MKEIRVAVEDDVYSNALARAAVMQTSVSDMVRDLLVELAAGMKEHEKLKSLESETIERIRKRGVRFSASQRLTRDELHDRNALR